MKGYKRPRPDRGNDAWELVAEQQGDPVTGRRRRVSRLYRGPERSAETALARLVADVSRDRLDPGTQAPLSLLLERWLEMVGPDLSPTTLHGYRQVIRSQILPALGQRPIGKIRTPDLDKFYRDLLTTRSPATVHQTHAILRRAFRQAVRWGWLEVNPAAEATPPPVRRKRPTLPTPEAVATLIAAADAIDPDLGCLLRVSVATGARRGEVCGLRWSRVDLETGSVVIDTAVVDVGGHVTVKGTKTHQDRTVALDSGTVAALRAQRVRTHALGLAAGTGRVADPFVFSRDPAGGEPIRPEVVTGRFRALARKHSPGTRLHDLRHFCATYLLAARVPVKTVSARLGHASAAMTLDVYGHALTEADRAAADVLGRMLGE